MSKIVVCKLLRLGKNGDKFDKKFTTTMRTNVKLDDEYVTEFNKNWKNSGQLYEVDEKLTKARDKKLGVKDETPEETPLP